MADATIIMKGSILIKSKMDSYKQCKLRENTAHRQLLVKINRDEGDFVEVSVNI